MVGNPWRNAVVVQPLKMANFTSLEVVMTQVILYEKRHMETH
jgi:hypothetical protein